MLRHLKKIIYKIVLRSQKRIVLYFVPDLTLWRALFDPGFRFITSAIILLSLWLCKYDGAMQHRHKNVLCMRENIFWPPLCTYRLNWARITSSGWWDDWDDTALQSQDSKFEPWWSEAEHATSRSRRLPTILTLTRGWGRNIFCFFQTAETGNRTPNSGVKGSGANHYPRAPAHNF